MIATGLKTSVLCALFYASTCWSESIPIYLDASANEVHGETLVYSFKEELRQSGRLSLTVVPSDAQLHLYLITVALATAPGFIAYSVVVGVPDASNKPPRLLHHSAGICDVLAIVECAQRIAAVTDSQVEKFQQELPEAIKGNLEKKAPKNH